MLELKDFYHLPILDSLLGEVVGDRSGGRPGGLVVVAGLDPRPPAAGLPPDELFLPSGRSALFGILARHLLEAGHGPSFVLARQADAVRVPRALHKRVRTLLLDGTEPIATLVSRALAQGAGTLVFDRLDEDTVGPALAAAEAGAHVVGQLDSVFAGCEVARRLTELLETSQDNPQAGGPTPTSPLAQRRSGLQSAEKRSGGPRLVGLDWVVTVQRLPVLCQNCRQPSEYSGERLKAHVPRGLDLPADARFYSAGGCSKCGFTGRLGDVAAFDVFRAEQSEPLLFSQASRLPMAEYVWRLAATGQVDIDEAVSFEAGRLRRTYHLLTVSEQALSASNEELRAKVAELESANRVLQRRTESLISLQSAAGTLTASLELGELARRITHHACAVCGADRGILYVLRPNLTAEVLASHGWDRPPIGTRLPALDVFGPESAGAPSESGPARFDGWPPGVSPRSPDLEGALLRSGLHVPLVAQSEVVGLMFVHSARRDGFSQAERSVLQAFADQAAVAIQRAGLIESLRDKISQLEEAQAELVQKERLERELELARQVQQSLLPRQFPLTPGFACAVRSEAARRVGGDFYDLFPLDGGLFGVAIADVSDKGMPAALYMALARSLLLAEARRERSPRAVLENVHRLLLELGDPDMFVTVFYGVLDPTTRMMTYARAGHERPLLLREGQAVELGGEGRFLGLIESADLALTEESVELLPGDRLALITDGLDDALDGDGKAFGPDRLRATLLTNLTLNAEELIEATFAALANHQGSAEPFDDMTMLVLQAL